MSPYKFLLHISLCASFGTVPVVYGQETSSPQGDMYGNAFVNYEPYVTPGEPEAPNNAPTLSKAHRATPSTPASVPAVGIQQVDVEFLKKIYPELEEKAIDVPSDENVTNYLLVRRIILDKAQRFSEAVTKVTRADPLLDENNRVPYSSTGAQSIRNADFLAQQQAAREMSKVGGLIIFVDSTCRFCSMELPVLAMINRTFGLEYLVISLDGSKPKGFSGQVTKDNGLFSKLKLKLTPSIVYVPHPHSYVDGQDTNQYLVISQGFYAEDELVKQIAYAGHDTKLLSADTMRDLSVWDRGVTSTQDLEHLKLDPSDPSTFKDTIEPLLQKEY